jgi:hypothetical protein
MTKHPFALPLDLANAPDIDGGGHPANSATVQKLAEYLSEAKVAGWDSVFLAFRAPDRTMTWETWGEWGHYELAGFLLRAVRKLTE